jgi:hypothetical protein
MMIASFFVNFVTNIIPYFGGVVNRAGKSFYQPLVKRVPRACAISATAKLILGATPRQNGGFFPNDLKTEPSYDIIQALLI